MSKYTTSPENEAEEPAVREWEATNGSNPTVETKVVIRMGTSATPTVSTDKVIRMTSGSNPTALESEAVGGTPMVITRQQANVGGTPTASTSLTPTVSTDKVIRLTDGLTRTASVNGTPTGSSGGGPVANVVSGSNTAELRWLIVGTQGTGNVAEGVNGNPTVSTDKMIRMFNCAAPTVIEGTASRGPVADVVSGSNTAELHRQIVGTEVTANVAQDQSMMVTAESSMPVIAAERLAA